MAGDKRKQPRVKFERGIDAAEDLDDAESIEGAVGVPDGVEDFGCAVFRRCVAVLDLQVGTKLAFQVADVA